jgi:hypothetical protein
MVDVRSSHVLGTPGATESHAVLKHGVVTQLRKIRSFWFDRIFGIMQHDGRAKSVFRFRGILYGARP